MLSFLSHAVQSSPSFPPFLLFNYSLPLLSVPPSLPPSAASKQGIYSWDPSTAGFGCPLSAFAFTSRCAPRQKGKSDEIRLRMFSANRNHCFLQRKLRGLGFGLFVKIYFGESFFLPPSNSAATIRQTFFPPRSLRSTLGICR